MKQYALTVFAICLIFGVIEHLSHEKFSTPQRFAIGVIMLYVILAPAVKLTEDFDPEKLSFGYDTETNMPEYSYEAVAEEAFSRGIVTLVASEYSIPVDNLRVEVVGFDFESMRAEKIRLILSGRAALADHRAIEDYINKMDIGDCRVEIEIG